MALDNAFLLILASFCRKSFGSYKYFYYLCSTKSKVMTKDNKYINFDEYIRQGEPGKRERLSIGRLLSDFKLLMV